MSGARPMRRASREVRGLAELREIVERARVLRVGSHDDEGPFVVPLSFGYEVGEKDGAPVWTFWAHSADEGRKVDAWTSDPVVALELDVPLGVIEGDYACSYSYAYESVMAVGTAVRVEDAAEKLHGLTLIMEHMAPGASASFSAEAVDRVSVWRFDVRALTGKRRA